METIKGTSVHRQTNEAVDFIKVNRAEGVRYIVFWKGDAEPTVYKASEFMEKFYN